MLFIKKYLLLFFLIENIIVQTSLLGSISEYLFYPFLAIGAVCLFDTKIWKGTTIQRFKPLYMLIFLYIFYEFIIGYEYINSRTLLYLIAKIVTFIIIITGITYNEYFYRTKAIFLFIVLTCSFLLYGLLTGGHVNASTGRALAGFTNENTAGSMGAIAIGMLLFYMRKRKWKWCPPIILLLIGFYGVLAGGSRAGFLMLFLLVFLRFGFNIKTIAFAGLFLVIGLFGMPAIGVKTVGIERMVNTYKGIEKSNRGSERLAAEMMISEKPWTGWGYEAKNQGEAAKISELLSHNGYLEIIKQMGIPCSIVYFSIILICILKYLNIWYKRHLKMNLFFALVLMLLIKANYESMYIGAHEYITNIFFFSLAMISSQYYYLKLNSGINDKSCN